jgi:cyclopropane fatty-acyl-phospholipid synthase-like methyltransferase
VTNADAKRYAPATLRNRAAITDVLRELLPAQGTVLEIASGSGEHVVHFAGQFPDLNWQPSDPDPAALASIDAWAADSGLTNIAPPVALDASARQWSVKAVDAILCINMIHISPWSATQGLMTGAATILPKGAPLYIYGPFRRAGTPTAPSNDAFDASLRSRNPDWGVRELEGVAEIASQAGLSVMFRKSA